MICEVGACHLNYGTQKALNGLRPRLLAEALVPHMKVPADWSALEFSVPPCVVADAETHNPFCAVRLLDVTVKPERDLARARLALLRIYAEVISATHPANLPNIPLNVTFVLDRLREGSNLLEGEGLLVAGLAPSVGS